MKEQFGLKYRKVLDILPDVADCTKGMLVLVGGTALALFHLGHRVSIDLDFVPLAAGDVAGKEALKGCLKKKGYRTLRAAYPNQFVVQFEDTSIKIEVFEPKGRIKSYDEHAVGNGKILVASIEDILLLKKQSYEERKEARDLFDIVFILKRMGHGFGEVREIIGKSGAPRNIESMKDLVLENSDYEFFMEVLGNASKTCD